MIIDPMTSSVVTGIIVALFAGIVLAVIRRRWQVLDRAEIRKQLYQENNDKVQKDIWRLNKTVLIMAKIIDDQTEKAHGDLNSSLEDIATELLRESDKS